MFGFNASVQAAASENVLDYAYGDRSEQEETKVMRLGDLNKRDVLSESGKTAAPEVTIPDLALRQ